MKIIHNSENCKVDTWNDPKWAVAVFAARESAATLESVVRAVVVACAGHSAQVDILVNGNPNLAQEIAHLFMQQPLNAGDEVRVCIWYIELGDKAQTWNTYVHRLYQRAELAFFIDGYAKPASNALHELSLALNKDDHALAATGVPSCGRSASKLLKTMQQSGGIHGNLFALTSRAIDEMRRRGFRLPMGLYRTDSLIGAAVNFGFDPSFNKWDTSLIKVQSTATWTFQSLQWWRLQDIITHVKRIKRQTQGLIENLAVHDHLAKRRQLPETLPITAQDLVLSWWYSKNGPTWYQIVLHPTWLIALRRFQEDRDWSHADRMPLKILEI